MRSSTSPASTCCWSTPPPQVWKTSGSLPEEVVAVSLDLNASFSNEVVLIATFGWAVVNAVAICGKSDLPGSVVAMFHHSNLTLPSADAPPPDPPVPQAAVMETDSAVKPASARKFRRLGRVLAMGPP